MEDYPDYPIASYGPITALLLNRFIFVYNIYTISEAKKYTEDKFLSLRGCGPKLWKELQDYIKDYENIENDHSY